MGEGPVHRRYPIRRRAPIVRIGVDPDLRDHQPDRYRRARRRLARLHDATKDSVHTVGYNSRSRTEVACPSGASGFPRSRSARMTQPDGHSRTSKAHDEREFSASIPESRLDFRAARRTVDRLDGFPGAADHRCERYGGNRWMEHRTLVLLYLAVHETLGRRPGARQQPEDAWRRGPDGESLGVRAGAVR